VTAIKKKVVVKKAPVRGTVRASTTSAAILGLGQSASSIKRPDFSDAGTRPEWAKYHQILMELRDQLLNQMSGLAKESAQELPGYSLHMADSGTDNFDRDFALSLLSSDQDAIYEIEAALSRIEKGTYGVCELTGKTIPKARLDAIPWTRFTVEAQAQLERDGALRQRRLGTLGTIDNSAPSDVEGEDEEPEEKSKEKE
jgi:RNA polymerase-binding transcription factor DksA